MSDHIGKATTMIDLDALEKLADEAPGKKWDLTAGFLEIDGMSPLFQLFGSPCDCGEGGNPICGNDGEAEAAAAFMIAAQPATIKALIAELKEATEHLTRCVELVPAPGAIEAADAFLARNGKGEG